MISPPPIPAAVVVLYRVRTEGLEIYWVRRADSLSFLGGFWAFPGGRVEEGDTLRQEQDSWVAAARRELWEETGVVLPDDPTRLIPLGRTVTPEWAPQRYEAAYFLVEAPPGAKPDISHAGGELTTGEWVNPTAALAAWERGERLASPVVLDVVRALVPGLHGAQQRASAALASHAGQGRLWDLVPGIAVAMLRTPTLPPATHTNCYVVGGAEVVVIDPGSPYPEEQQELAQVLAGRRVRAIWLTHHHGDHVGGAGHLSGRLGVPIFAHPEALPLLAGRVPGLAGLRSGHVETLPGRPERRLRVLATPGHARDHLCFLEETTRFLVCGDMVAGTGSVLIDPEDGDMAAYLASLQVLRTLKARVLLPAHGAVITNCSSKLDEVVRHRLWREERVATALGACGSATLAELVPLTYDDVAPALYPLAERSLLAHLLKLVKEGRAERETNGRFALVRPSAR